MLYQKRGLAVSGLAQDLLSREPGDRIPSISDYMESLKVSRGTVQNGLNYLKEQGAVSLTSRGQLGTYIDALDKRALQSSTSAPELLGSMPLPYSRTYQGLATALYDAMSPFAANLVYVRGVEGRLRLIENGVCHFTVCSLYAAKQAIEDGAHIQIAADLGPKTYLSRHVLVLRDPTAKGIEPGMRVAYDPSSLDQSHLTQDVVRGVENVQLVEMRSHQTVAAIRKNVIDAGVWNLDEIIDSGYTDLNWVELDEGAAGDIFSSAAIVVKTGQDFIVRLLHRYVDPAKVRRIQCDVLEGKLPADY